MGGLSAGIEPVDIGIGLQLKQPLAAFFPRGLAQLAQEAWCYGIQRFKVGHGPSPIRPSDAGSLDTMGVGFPSDRPRWVKECVLRGREPGRTRI